MANSTNHRSSAKSGNLRSDAPGATAELQQLRETNDRLRKKPKCPLWLHSGTGQWAKKIRGHHFYFGTDKDSAIQEYLRVREYLKAGKLPPPRDNELVTLKTLGDTFLTHKKHQVQIGELTQASYDDYEDTCQRLADNLGKHTAVQSLGPDDLVKYRHKLARTWGPNTLGNEINRCRVVLRFAFENGLIDRPVRFGEFKRPKKVALRRHRSTIGPRVFTPAELHAIIDAADVHVRAMVYLGINCGFGNADCGTLPLAALELNAGWIDFPRRKTGIERRCPLWPETVTALKQSIAKRKDPSDRSNRDLVFVTKYGGAWFADGVKNWPLSAEFRKLLDSLNVYFCKCGYKLISTNAPEDGKCEKCGKKLRREQSGIRRPGLSFYTLRHCFQTIGDQTGDYIATRRVMGHADSSISDHYREQFPDERLRAVTDHVHEWLFGTTKAK